MRVMLRHLLVEQKETELCEARMREQWRGEARGDFVHLCYKLSEYLSDKKESTDSYQRHKDVEKLQISNTNQKYRLASVYLKYLFI